MNIILVTGGSGKTGRRVAAQLDKMGVARRVASRSACGSGTVTFDWNSPETYDAALESVSAVYLVAPPGAVDPLPSMQMFLERALEVGVEKFVLLSASSIEEDGPMMGEVHGWLRRNAPSWVVLRPTWFMQNFSEQQHLPTIIANDAIYSATGNGKVGFINADDIASAAVSALRDRERSTKEVILTGPEPLSYDEVADLFSTGLGRRIRHVRLTEKEMADRFETFGVPPEFAPFLAAMDTAISHGAENKTTSGVLDMTGSHPSSFEVFISTQISLWEKPVLDSA